MTDENEYMSELAIEMQGVSKTYPHFQLNNIDLQLAKGSIMGFIGPNGAGKSTTLRILMGLVHQDAGQVKVYGHDMPGQQVAAKWNIGYASEDMRLYKNATFQWHMDFMQSIYPEWDKQYAKYLLSCFDLVAEQKLKGFSHGQRVKAGLLLLLARRPKLLILDEPTTGLDPVARHEVLNELMEVLVDEDRSVLFSSHNTKDIEQLSDQITFIDRGKIVNSQDKENYLDSWKRIRFSVKESAELNKLPGVIEIRQTGRLATIVTKQYSDEIMSSYQSQGATVQNVENMTLEEIFVAEVQANRQRKAS